MLVSKAVAAGAYYHVLGEYERAIDALIPLGDAYEALENYEAVLEAFQLDFDYVEIDDERPMYLVIKISQMMELAGIELPEEGVEEAEWSVRTRGCWQGLESLPSYPVSNHLR